MAKPKKTEPISPPALKLADGREFTLVLDFNAWIAAETVLGKPWRQIVAEGAAGFVGALRAILWAALQANHSELTLDDAMAMFESDGVAVGAALTHAVEAKKFA